MAKQQVEQIEGIVTEALPNAMFKVKPDGQEQEILTYLAGRMRKFRIRVLIGDRVQVELDPYGGKGRISRRF